MEKENAHQPQNHDYLTFAEVASEEIYWACAGYNLFMQCETLNRAAFGELPQGFTYRLCRRDELETWTRIAVEAPYVQYVTDYYDAFYAPRADEFFQRCSFVCDAEDRPVATCFVWKAYESINTLAWFRTLPAYEGMGLGRALLGKVLAGAEYPIYVHTHPTGARAVKLYSDFGFRLISDPVIGFRENNLHESLPILKKIMSPADFAALQIVKADTPLLKAARSRKTAEF